MPLRPRQTPLPDVAIVGCGVVGRGWIPVFARAGCAVRVYDANPAQLEVAAAWLAGPEPHGAASGPPAPGSVRFLHDLGAAVAGAGYVQESVAEDLALKRAVFTQIEHHADPQAYLASSTSALDINEIARGARRPERCFTVHPFNPASVLPVVEVLGTAAATPQQLAGLTSFLAKVGQMPVVLRRFVPGYLGNRLQAAVMREALDLVASGVADADGIDAVLSHALALRWVPLGVFGTNHTNDDQGLRGYYARFWPSYRGLMATLAAQAPELDAAAFAAIAGTVDRRFGSAPVAAVARWRDRFVEAIRKLQDEQPFRP
jgi:L-gulonate 3-dehydrogenase